MKNSILIKIALLLILPFAFANSAFAKGPTYTNWSGQAIKGYDTVAYFTKNKAVKGSKEFSYEWNKAKWLFSSLGNLNKFKESPEKYAPQYGGYCAFAAHKNSLASVDPTQFTIVNDKLYLNYNKSINNKWNTNKEEFIISGDKNWPGLLSTTK